MSHPKLVSLFQKDTHSNLIGAMLEAVEPGYKPYPRGVLPSRGQCRERKPFGGPLIVKRQ
jgi:hypothetical protein